jgi:hypothetical protein
MHPRLPALFITFGLCAAVAAVTRAGSTSDTPQHTVPPPANQGEVVVGLCDGKTTAVMKVKPGERPTRDQAQAVADQLMAEWRSKNPNALWDDGVQIAQAPTAGAPPAQAGEAPGPAGAAIELQRGSGAVPARQGAAEGAPQAARSRENVSGGEREAQGETAGAAGGLPAGPQGPVQEGHTYGAFSERDERIWEVATQRFIEEGSRIFHSADALGGTIAVSCDMCHPDGANTHPETYPKYQVQFQRVALLRDMINWCIENPVRGIPLHDDDEKLRALEAYILAQRKGVPLEYGKH